VVLRRPAVCIEIGETDANCVRVGITRGIVVVFIAFK
jgi:hypothetical protein